MARYVEHGAARGLGEICMTEHLHRFAAARGLLEPGLVAASARLDDVAAYREALAAAATRACRCSRGIELD